MGPKRTYIKAWRSVALKHGPYGSRLGSIAGKRADGRLSVGPSYADTRMHLLMSHL